MIFKKTVSAPPMKVKTVNELQGQAKKPKTKVLSLLDFIAAIHELSSGISLDKMLEQAFILMGGTQNDGLTMTQLHRAIRNQ